MYNNQVKSLLKSVVLGLALGVMLFLLGKGISKISNYSLKDILFVAGMLIFAIACMSFIGGKSLGIPIEGLDNQNAEYVANTVLTANIINVEKNNILGIRTKSLLNMISLGFGGIICIMINFII